MRTVRRTNYPAFFLHFAVLGIPYLLYFLLALFKEAVILVTDGFAGVIVIIALLLPDRDRYIEVEGDEE